VKLGRRRGDNAPMSLIEFVDQGASAAAAPQDTKKKAKAGASEKPDKADKPSKDKPAAEKRTKKAAKAEAEE
jgi:large subunit ribosomal protein L17